ncbi:hypothetical protein BDV38DRAFT_257616 [Aspergillus pseudotamarii]|uniref:Uncharacterized protein n=1 Tax=Aspergillus pseudotamarii TaxID=132259 RepID=A0A5N6SKK0_ASPPS|nr:uncharacterized protein BDV38DRAFT_257616 [Aspergillus pseudotamarii]KAE8133654.1 hypothetical protein BDV38DRAFT_257616 [Aspergillus pseudotamarii]
MHSVAFSSHTRALFFCHSLWQILAFTKTSHFSLNNGQNSDSALSLYLCEWVSGSGRLVLEAFKAMIISRFW